jgi:hypothetical protein
MREAAALPLAVITRHTVTEAHQAVEDGTAASKIVIDMAD